MNKSSILFLIAAIFLGVAIYSCQNVTSGDPLDSSTTTTSNESSTTSTTENVATTTTLASLSGVSASWNGDYSLSDVKSIYVANGKIHYAFNDAVWIPDALISLYSFTYTENEVTGVMNISSTSWVKFTRLLNGNLEYTSSSDSSVVTYVKM